MFARKRCKCTGICQFFFITTPTRKLNTLNKSRHHELNRKAITGIRYVFYIIALNGLNRRYYKDALFYDAFLQFLFNLNKFGDTVVHLFDCLEFSQTKTPFVGDIIDTTFSFSVFAPGSSDL